MENLCMDSYGMEEKKVLRFELLGSFSYGDGERENTAYSRSAMRAGKKTLSFLQYLIVNHVRHISSEELIERFWTEDASSAPGNALRNMLFKVRSLLKNMFPEQEELFLTFPGFYAWTPDVYIELDTELFEEICLEAKKASGDTYLELLMQAISLYKGDFLPANESDWALVLRQYYRTLYLDICKAALPLLQKKELWVEIISVCEQAYRIDFTMEEFTAYQMRALIALGRAGDAVALCDVFRGKMQQEFGVSLSDQIEQICALAVGLKKKNLEASDIFNLVCESDREGQCAFFCTFEMFQNIVALEKRHLARSGHNSALVIISLEKDAVPTTDARRLERILLEGLRVGDPVARLEAGSYILMLTGANEENAQMVISRLDSSFHKTYRHSKVRLSYKIAALR